MALNENGDGTFTDTTTRLTWQNEDDGVERDFEEARAYCRRLSLGGFTGWRLPTLLEFQALTKEAKVASLKVNTYYNTETGADYWTATIGPQRNVAHIGDGTTMFLRNKYCVRAVRP
jgi:formylglycine-generating enzyme required for sulfatase activity